MKKLIYLSLVCVSLIALSCGNSNKKTTDTKDSTVTNINNQTKIIDKSEKIKEDIIKDKNDMVIYDSNRENLKLSFSDTIKLSKSYFFSNTKSKDLFLLTIKPGFVKKSKAELKIIRADNKVIYVDSFDAFYFIKGIFEPDTISTDGQEAYEKYMEEYWKSLTPKQYDSYFKKSVKKFFDAITFINRAKIKELNLWNDITNKDFLNEIIADPTIKLIDIICFDCDEGGSIICYSRKQGKVVTLLEHD